ncbi:type II toxin-antitoxin system Phd/YefM family antitoxin [Flammeovirga yaeyamensis]|uniref:Antitoxin n=1 Tax=Flammeovirga yaeyamensis TaxID=367791 RepID=A0AAX1MZ65_9BACT|nr:type II toxin-antitoxin system Phd/YefM family antitoxin [Flammeovirga yaeyamensis]MBB3695954.1 antitoxin YefM [Flammeovirga yaeyamensis]NMF34642.1 type II toxin-antitoxin system Phd/YefM family antitoxin [Flammeovirga yaeyamensis]QWG00529.1 type II toxin-antitoxin system Phd/YefM family antitoxin [Flammeovirga yaeyamensis]
MIFTTITNFRANAKSFLDKIIGDFEELTITTNKGNFVVITEEEYNSLKETEYILSNPEKMEAINESLEDYKEGKSKKFDNLDDTFDALGI